MPQLEWNFRYVLVTYAQCGDLDPWRVVERFSSLGAECIVGREHHEDGGLHLHVFADFGRKFRSRKADILDVDGRHPNLAPIKRTPAKAYDYAIKDGDVVAGGLERPVEGGVGNGTSADKWARITQAEDRDEFWALVHELDPKAAACSFNALSKYADWRFAEKPPLYEHDGRIKFVQGDADGRDDWVSQSGIGLDEPFLGNRVKSLVLFGGTRTGKTTWARSLGRHLYCIGLVSGAECAKGADAEYAVFDDIRGGFGFFHGYKEWLGAQPHVSIKQLYREPFYMKWGKPSIWICNTDPRTDAYGPNATPDWEWMEGNCVFIEVKDSLIESISHASTE
nr:MAG: replication associated protein [Genomoviridae sp.]